MNRTLVQDEPNDGAASRSTLADQGLGRLDGAHTKRPDVAAFVARPDPLFHFVLLALSSVVLLLALALSVRGQTQVVLPLLGVPLPELCMMRRTMGFDCPGCGMTRCFIALAHGDVASAWSYNPAGLWLFAIMAFQIPYRSYQLWRIRRGRSEIMLSRTAQVVLGTLAVVLIGQWALRLSGVAF
jgi:uncharacterized protein DUF2752